MAKIAKKRPAQKKSSKPAPPTDASTNLDDEAPRKVGPKVRINFDLDRAVWRQLKIRATEEDAAIAEVMRRLVSEYLSK